MTTVSILGSKWAAPRRDQHPPDGSESLRMLEAVSELARIHAELAAYKAALDQHAIVAVTDRRGTIISVNDGFCRTSGYTAEELIGKTHRVVNSGHHPKRFFVQMWRVIGKGEVWHGEVCNRAKDGRLYWVDTTIVPTRGTCGAISGFISIRYEITERKRAEASLREENAKRAKAETLLRDVFETIPDGIAAFDADDRLILCNEAYRSTYPNAAPAIVEGVRFEEILRFGMENGQFPEAGSTPARREAWIRARMAEHANPRRPLVQKLADGRWVQVQEKRSSVGHVVGVRTNISELKKAESTIKRQAEEDALTGLANRGVLVRRLSAAIGARRRDGGRGALFSLDLDKFKAVNDTLGHDAGDQLLITLARRLEQSVADAGTVARVSGDEFAILYTQLRDERDATDIAAELLLRLDEPVRIGERYVKPHCSVGIALFPDETTTAKDVLKHADIALYRAKAMGRRRSCIFDPTMRAGLDFRHQLADALTMALLKGEIEIAMQPKIAFADGRHIGFEALVRWRHEGEPVAPPTLVEVAEETGLIVALGAKVLDLALGTIRHLRDREMNPGSIAVNVAAAQLRQDDFIETVTFLLEKHRLDAAALEIEVTENVLLDSAAEGIASNLATLHEMGVRISLDDFGTGYASLAHLKRFKVDCLKIDRSFVRDLERDPEDAILTRTIISLAHSLNLEVVAEGIETVEQYRFLEEHGCDYAQGYLISRPIESDAVEAYLLSYLEKDGAPAA